MKLKKLIMLAILVLLIIGCSDDGKKSLGFTLDLDEIDSNSDVAGRSFGIYYWDIERFKKGTDDRFSEDYVLVVLYNESFKEKIISQEAILTLTINDSTYNHAEIDPELVYEDSSLFFAVEKKSTDFANFTLTYVCDDFEFVDNGTITFANRIVYLNPVNGFDDGTVVRLDWRLLKNNSYQLLSAQNTKIGSENPFYNKKLRGSARSFTFPEEYAVDFNCWNSYYSITEVKQMHTPKTIGLSVKIYAFNISGDKREEARTQRQIVADQFKMLHKPLLKSLEF